MIRFAFLAVFLIAAGLAFGAFSLMRNTGPSLERPATPATAPAPEAAAPDLPEPVYFLADQDFESGAFALVMWGVGPEGQDMVLTDRDALVASQPDVFVRPNTRENDIAITTDAQDADQRILTLFRDEEPILTLLCRAMPCDPADVDTLNFTNLLDAAQPLLQINETHDNYDAYLDAVAFVTATPEYAFLGLGVNGDAPHPAPQQTPMAALVLPTIYRFADAPLDIETHTALLSAVVERALPDGASVTKLTITQHDPAILIEMETGRPATRAGEVIPFADIVLYTPRFEVEGTASLSEDTLESLTEDTMLRVDWEQAADAFVASLSLPCTECFGVQAVGDVFNRANLTAATPERYPLSFYDLREAP